MSVTDLHRWEFKEDGDIEAGEQAIVEYARHLEESFDGLQLSLWLKDRENPRLYFHVAVYADDDALTAASSGDGTQKFVEKLYPEIDELTHVISQCDDITSTGGPVDRLMPV